MMCVFPGATGESQAREVSGDAGVLGRGRGRGHPSLAAGRVGAAGSASSSKGAAGKGRGTVRIQETGLELSRFRHLGINSEYCSEQDVVRARALIDATEVQPEAVMTIPLHCYEDLCDSRGRGPIWVTKREHDRASDQFDAEGLCYEIDTQGFGY